MQLYQKNRIIKKIWKIFPGYVKNKNVAEHRKYGIFLVVKICKPEKSIAYMVNI